MDAGFDADAAIDGGTVEVCEDAGTTPDAPPAAECSSANFKKEDGSPIFPTADFDAKYKCGEVTGNTGSSAIAQRIGNAPLTNGTRYAIAVAATDRFGNVGLLSDVVCETPELTTDFWDEYRKAGGSAGGCAIGGSEIPVGSMTAMIVGAALAVSAVRRRMTNRSAGRPQSPPR